MKEINRNHKDTLFRQVFKDNKHFSDLYKLCSGKRVNADEITRFDLDSEVVQRERYNDVSFLTDDNRVILMIEHQSTVSGNLAVKLGAYFFDLLRLWAEHEGVSIHDKQERQLPKPEMYVVYNGSKPYGKQEDVFVSGRFLSITVPIVNIKYDYLEDQSSGNYVAGYAFLQHEFVLGVYSGLADKDAFRRAVESCKTRGYLKGIVEKEDFISMNIDLFSYDNQLRYEGEVKRNLEFARTMLKAGEPVEKIILYTSLTREEIEKLRDEMQPLAAG